MNEPAPTLPGRRPEPWGLLLVVGLIFAVSTSDRAVMPLLKATIGKELTLSNTAYSALVTAFMVPYTVSYLFVGRVIAALGVRSTLALATLTISAATALNGTATGPVQLLAGMFLLGVGQAGIVPSATLCILTLFPARRHATAYATINGIQTLASVVCPAYVALVVAGLGWRWSFLLLVFAGVALLATWTLAFRTTSQSLDTRAEKRTGGSFRAVFASPDARRLILVRLVSDPFWFFFQFWFPSFLREQLGLSLTQVGEIAWIPPLTTLGAVALFGTFSDAFVKRGVPEIRARVIPLLFSLVLAPAGMLLPFVTEAPAAIALAAALSALCGIWLSLTALAMGSALPREHVATGLGLMSAIGGTTAILFNALAGPVFDHLGHRLPFVLGACLHPAAGLLLILHFRPLFKSAPSRP